MKPMPRKERDALFERLTGDPASHFRLHLAAAALRIAEGLGPQALERHPFLGGYVEQVRPLLEGEVSSRALERELLLWEATGPRHLPLRSLGAEVGLSLGARLAVVGVGMVEEDSRFGALWAALQDGGARRPTLETIGRLFGEPPHPDPWGLLSGLLDLGVLETDDAPARPRAEWPLGVPSPLWDLLRGDAPRGGARLVDRALLPRLDELILQVEVANRVARVVPLLRSGEVPLLVLRASPGADLEALAGAVARELGRNLLVLEAPHFPKRGASLSALAAASGGLVFGRFELGPGEVVALPPGLRGPLVLGLGRSGGVEGQAVLGAVSLEIPPPGREERARAWAAGLGPEAPAAEVEILAERFRLPQGHLGRLVKLARLQAKLAGRDLVTLGDAREASRLLRREVLDTLAERMDVGGDWSAVVVGPGTRERLDELELRCRQRERLLDHLGPAFGTVKSRGVRALLAGASGTGKTLAARVLASVLGMDLYRVDLAAVVNKYIGETEKNLHRVLSLAEDLDVVLLLDEGDALLGGRTEVRSANDRYANMETNFLLQRLEAYDGILLVTTNVGDNIDRAFRRRMDVMVPFVAPGPVERTLIWSAHLPERNQVGMDTLELAARRFPMTGGQIRNAALYATSIALEEGVPVGEKHLEAALRSERQKAGATWPLEREPTELVSGFIDALAR